MEEGTSQVHARLNKICDSRSVSFRTRFRLFKSLVVPYAVLLRDANPVHRIGAANPSVFRETWECPTLEQKTNDFVRHLSFCCRSPEAGVSFMSSDMIPCQRRLNRVTLKAVDPEANRAKAD